MPQRVVSKGWLVLALIFGTSCLVQAIAIVSAKKLDANVGYVSTRSNLLWTADDGKTWQNITPPLSNSDRLADVFFLNNVFGWVLLESNSLSGAHQFTLAKTTNGGALWSISPISLSFRGISETPLSGSGQVRFVSATHGWLSLERATSSNFRFNILLTTTDAGLTWEPSPSAPDDGGPLLFVNATEGWAVGGPENDKLFVTHDGAISWSEVVLSPPSNVRPHSRPRYELPTFEDEKHGYLPVKFFAHGTAPDSVLFATRDGGKSWSPGRFAPSDKEQAKSVLIGSTWISAFVDDSRLSIAAVDKSGSIDLESASLSSKGMAVADLSYTSTAEGWALLSGGKCEAFKSNCLQIASLLSTVNGGSSWSDITPAFLRSDMKSLGGGGGSEGAGKPIAQGVNNVLVARTSTGFGFDMCSITSPAQMKAWWDDSPYNDVNVYIGGISRTCPNRDLKASWVTTITSQGWGLIPTWVGPQSACACNGSQCKPFPHLIDPNKAREQGIQEAEAAKQTASGLGLSGDPIYYDMEPFTVRNAQCSAAVRDFVAGWVSQMHTDDQWGAFQYAGVYGTPSAAAIDFTDSSGSQIPDDVWITLFNGAETVWDLGVLPNSSWTNDQRIHQYGGPNSEVWGGSRLQVDNDIESAPVAGGIGKNGTLSLELSSQPMTFVGLGPDAFGDGQVQATLGSCSPVGDTTRCLLSGAFSGLIPAGVYKIDSQYSGTGSSPITGISTVPGGDFYTFDLSSVTWSVTANDPNGPFVLPSPTFSLFFDSSATCTGVVVCSAANVGQTIGATMTGQVTGTVSF